MLRHLLILLPPSIVALLAWMLLPGTSVERAFFHLSSKTIKSTSFLVIGNGQQETPYSLLTITSPSKEIRTEQPISIEITDDPEQIFQSSPPSPIDYAVILKNVRRLGSNSISISTPLSWQKADMISLIALDRQLDAFPSPITSAPLTRSPTPSHIPPAFRRASISVATVKKSDILSIPIINRVSIPDVILGQKTSLAGFSVLESETQTEQPYLIARWEDRIVFSSLLLTALDHYGKKIEEVTIRADQYISLSKNGPYIPIDSYGRLKILPVANTEQYENPILATELIDAPDDLIIKKLPKPIIIRNNLSSIDDSERIFSESIASTVSKLCHIDGYMKTRSFPRFFWLSEILFLASLNSMLYAIFTLFPAHRRLLFIVFLMLLIAFHFIIFTAVRYWPPTIPSLIAVLITFLIPNLLAQNLPTESSDIPPNEPN